MNYLGTVQLAGDFSGDLAAESFLTEKIATISANIATEEVLYKGKVRGDIRAIKKVKNTKEAEVTGENHSPNLNIKKGALFEG